MPPPSNRLDECLDALERFLHSEDVALPPLIRAGLAHVQFEAIHPFLDGNGRLGRLLITLILCEAGVLREPKASAETLGPLVVPASHNDRVEAKAPRTRRPQAQP